MATRLLFSGSQFSANYPSTSGAQQSPSAAFLTTGGSVVAFESPFNGDTFNYDINMVELVTGELGVQSFSESQLDPSVAARLDGLVGVVYQNPRHVNNTADTSSNITYARFGAIGNFGAPISIADLSTPLFSPDIATLSTGRQIVVFVRDFGGGDTDILLNVVDVTGLATSFPDTAPPAVENNSAAQNIAFVAASGNQALIAYLDTTGTTLGSTNVVAKLFNGDFNTLGPTIPIADHSGAFTYLNVAALSDNRYVIVYADNFDIWGRIYDPSTPGGAFLSDEFQLDRPNGGIIGQFSAAPTVDGGFIVVWAENNTNYNIRAHRFDARGLAFGDEFVVNTLTNNDQTEPTIATFGSQVLAAWTDFAPRFVDPFPTSIQGQFLTTTVFDYDSAGIGDLDGNGRVDILFQNDTGDVAVWQTNSNGQVFSINSLGQRPAGYLIDGAGNFNSTPGDDILLRSSGGTLAIWPTAGIAVGAPVVIGNAPNTYHNAGIGDFTGDGQDDLLFRHDTGQIVSWAVANNTLAAPAQILGATSLSYHIVGIDDFTGDHQADILFRNDDGTIAVWQVANNQLLSATAVGATSTAYHVVSTGDFDGNGAKDILFRGDTGELVEWLLDSSGGLLTSPTSIGTVTANYHVDGTGDLNGDGRDDIIFRDAGGTVVQWLMNGTSLASPPAVMGTVAVDYAIAAHHFDLV